MNSLSFLSIHYVSLFNRLMMFIGLYLFLFHSILAQAPYTGGPGDGYASTSLSLLSTSQQAVLHSSVKIYPLPVKSTASLYIVLEHIHERPIQVQLIHITGKILVSYHWDFAENGELKKWDLSDLSVPPDVYILKIIFKDFTISRKVQIIP